MKYNIVVFYMCINNFIKIHKDRWKTKMIKKSKNKRKK